MKITIVSHSNVPSGDLARAGQLDTLLVYTTDQGNTDAVVIPGAAPTDAEISASVKANEDKRARNAGRQLEV